MMQLTRKRVQTTALGGGLNAFRWFECGRATPGLTHEDCRNVEKRLEEVRKTGTFVWWFPRDHRLIVLEVNQTLAGATAIAMLD